jgi:drug/metabolite transporter (DMT)-like permease
LKDFNLKDAKGPLLVTGASVIWGIGYPFWKVLSANLDFLSLTLLSFLATSAVLFTIDHHTIPKLIASFNKAPLLIITLGLSAGICGTGLFFIALERLDSGLVAFLEKLQVISVLIFARIFLHELLAPKKIPVVFLTLMLAFFLMVPDPLHIDLQKLDLLGLCAGVACSAFYGANVVMYKLLSKKEIPNNDIVFFRMFIGGILILPVVLIQTESLHAIASLEFRNILLLLFLCIVTQAGAFKLFVSGLKYTTAATSGFIELLTPIVALCVGITFFGEMLSVQQLLIIPLYLACIGLLTITPQEKPGR